MPASKVFTVIIGTLMALMVIWGILTRLIPHFLPTPPVKWRLRVNNAIKKANSVENKTPVMDFGWKTGAVRRQMILASSNPSDYTNKRFGNAIHVGKTDRENREAFINRMVPQLRSYKRNIFGFFHPYCNAGGGGEKVLWKAVESTLQKNPQDVVVIYTGDNDVSGPEILANVYKRFEYKLDESRIVFIFLKRRYLVDSKTWPRLTLLGQALGSIILAFEALYKLPPDVWCDTMGYPFTYPFIHWFASIPVIAYTHYPIISSDMLDKLILLPSFKSSLKLKLKYYYWKLFMQLYKFAGKFVDVSITNSTWTNNHIKQIWSTGSSKIIYPPCSTENLVFKGIKEKWTRKNRAVVIAQFRPEKRHELIIRSFASLLDTISVEQRSKVPQLILIGSTRSDKDREYVEELKKLAYETLKIPANLVEFHTDCQYEQMKTFLHTSSYGINAMWNEHFGIAVVEYIASGLIPLVHASAGPLLDIVVPWDSKRRVQADHDSIYNRTGFFFKDPSDPDYGKKDYETYPTLTDLFITVINLTDDEKLQISQRGQQCVLNKFSDLSFSRAWNEVLEEIEEIEPEYAKRRS